MDDSRDAVAERWRGEQRAYSDWAARLDLALLEAMADFSPPPPARRITSAPLGGGDSEGPHRVASSEPAEHVAEHVPKPVQPAANRALLVVEPIARFKVLRDVEHLLAHVPGLVEARLESLEEGTAVYRLTFGDRAPDDAAVAAALAPLGLHAALISNPAR